MSQIYQNPTDTTTSPAAVHRAKAEANRRTIRAWKASRTDVCDFFVRHRERRHALFTTSPADYVGQFPDQFNVAVVRALQSNSIVVAAQYIPNSRTVVRLLWPVYRGPVHFDGDDEAKARILFDGASRDHSGDIARDVFWAGGPWREVTVR